MKANLNQMQISESAINSIAVSMPFIQTLVSDCSENKNPTELIKLNTFISLLANRLENSEETIDTVYLASDEAKTILKRTIEIYINENQPEKLELLNRFLTNFFDVRFSTDTNKQKVLQALEKINSTQALILRDTTEWLILAYGRDVVKQSIDYKPESTEQQYVGYMMESVVAIFARLTIENTAPFLDALVEIGVLEIANNGEPIQHFGQTGRGVKPSKLGLQLLEYLGISIAKMPERNDLIKK